MTTDTTPTGMASLIERLEKGSGEDRELDLAIGKLWPAPQPFSVSIVRLRDGKPALPAFTSNLNAALGFATAVLPGWHAILYTETGAVEMYDATLTPPNSHYTEGAAATLARSILVATLRALAKDTTDAE